MHDDSSDRRSKSAQRAAPLSASSAMRRVLRRARDGSTLTVTETALLLTSRGDALEALCSIAVGRRTARLVSEHRPGIVTYSRKVFIPLTRLCRDRCHYCTFVASPAALRRQGHQLFLEIDEVVDIARRGAALGCKEALFTLGDRPEDRWPQAKQWLDERGYDSTIDYLRAAAIRVLEETGLLPHLNPGVLSWSELAALKPVSPSMGMMLETTSTRLHTTPGECHFGSPDKAPEVRLRTIADAGRHAIPFTTGILVGIGENIEERAESLHALQKLHREFGHIQEVIVQNFLAKPDTAMRDSPDAEREAFLAAVATARVVLDPKIALQAPPNLVDEDGIRDLLNAGVDDLGGISPLTPDHVNPERPWPELSRLAALLGDEGLELRERLTAHPRFVTGGPQWIDPRIRGHVAVLSDPATGMALGPVAGESGPVVQPQPRPWQEPEAQWDTAGRADLATTIDTSGRATDTRSDIAESFGNWDSIRDAARSVERTPANAASVPSDINVRRALSLAEADPASLSDSQYLTLMTATGADLVEVAALADALRTQVCGDEVTYVVNRNINFTNICYTGCRFCAFAQRKGDADAFSLSVAEVADRAFEAHVAGATEVCMQGGIDPDLPVSAYADLVRGVTKRVPGMHVHAFSPMEIASACARSGRTAREILIELREAGLGSIPGTAAEILDDEVRWVLTKGKLPAQEWIDIVCTAHELGIPSSSTMMYGHVDYPHHWVSHIRTLREIQERTGGFTEFVPLPFVHHSAPLYLAGAARPGPTQRDDIAVHAVARIMLHGAIDNIQTSWVKLGVDGTRAMLQSGANDVGGTLMEETISRMAGSEHGSAKTVADLVEIASGIGRPVRQRTTVYSEVASTTFAGVSLLTARA